MGFCRAPSVIKKHELELLYRLGTLHVYLLRNIWRICAEKVIIIIIIIITLVYTPSWKSIRNEALQKINSSHSAPCPLISYSYSYFTTTPAHRCVPAPKWTTVQVSLALDSLQSRKNHHPVVIVLTRPFKKTIRTVCTYIWPNYNTSPT